VKKFYFGMGGFGLHHILTRPRVKWYKHLIATSAAIMHAKFNFFMNIFIALAQILMYRALNFIRNDFNSTAIP
jgi:hypothetical protein